MDYKNNGLDLLNFIKVATSPFHVVESSAALLEDAGFTRLDVTQKWSLEVGHSYYTVPYGTTLFAFTLPENMENTSFRIEASHTDYPCLRIKPIAELQEGDYLRLDTGVYGGPIL